MSPMSLPPHPARSSLRARLLLPGGAHELAALVDSGADANIISGELVRQLGLRQEPLSSPAPATALDGHSLGTITHQTAPVPMLLSGNHHEVIQFHIIDHPDIPLILGFPWLQLHNPHIDWRGGVVSRVHDPSRWIRPRSQL